MSDFEIDSLCPRCDGVITHEPRGRCTCESCGCRLRVRYDGAEYILEPIKALKERESET